MGQRTGQRSKAGARRDVNLGAVEMVSHLTGPRQIRRLVGGHHRPARGAYSLSEGGGKKANEEEEMEERERRERRGSLPEPH